MEIKQLDIDDNQSYLLGFLQSDGHRLSSQTNGFEIELSSQDRDILDKIKDVLSIPNDIVVRTRDTNYKDRYTSCRLHINGKAITGIKDFIPFGSKSEIVKPPSEVGYSEPDYWRGFIDGDGSLGFRKASKNKKSATEPFISIATSSEYIARSFEQFVFKHFYSKNRFHRNERDDQFNITIAGYYCPAIVKRICYPGCLGLDRKIAEADSILRSDNLSTHARLPFSREEDAILLEADQRKALALPNRKLSVAKSRLKYLLSKGIDSPVKLFDIEYFV